MLRKTDFYAVSVRRNSYLIAAVQVAESVIHMSNGLLATDRTLRRHLEYRPFLIDHLVFISIRHWDPDMRSLASQSLRALCELDLSNLGPHVMARVVSIEFPSQTTPSEPKTPSRLHCSVPWMGMKSMAHF